MVDRPLPHTEVDFAHNSERQFAKLLDFYGIEWRYEPRTFTLATDRSANPTEAFTPDFYLPAFELYIEITTLRQKLVTKKNRKARRLMELHPEVQVKVLYQRDYLNLMVKHGLEEPSQLAGTVTPEGPDGGPWQPAGETAASLLGLGTLQRPEDSSGADLP
jgi:hypoxanthine phosphoribosyltransferase